eukprot:TRINITY_DN2136_c0_g1_i1.p1 TRINITY_DN2136_c0_g1~~TRINITY_DN2136_c0_g1_i1.p1  ORF type:complete len:518 (-),score=98.66 TRINITY_DN2136_c0_g1_i1:495-2048(-)
MPDPLFLAFLPSGCSLTEACLHAEAESGNALAAAVLGLLFMTGCLRPDEVQGRALLSTAAPSAEALRLTHVLWRDVQGEPEELESTLENLICIANRETGDPETAFAQLACGFETTSAAHARELGLRITAPRAPDRLLAKKWLQQARDAGLECAAYPLACLQLSVNEEDEVCAGDKESAVDLLRPLVDRGLPAACYRLGLCLARGVGVPDADPQEGVRLLRLAAEAALPGALFSLASCYYNGEGTEIDLEKAAGLFKQASDAGHLWAALDFALCLRNGEGVDCDGAAALAVFRTIEACANRDPLAAATALNNIGRMHLTGEGGFVADPEMAVALFCKAAEQGCNWALSDLGLCYRHGTGVEPDLRMARDLFRQAVERATKAKETDVLRTAQYNLACCLFEGTEDDGVDCDTEAAAELYRQSADAEYAWAQIDLALCYVEGSGVELDRVEGERLLWAAALSRDAEASAAALYQLAVYAETHEHEDGEEFVCKKAMELYRRAADAGNEDANAILQELECE